MKKVVMVAAPIHPVPPRKGAAVEWWMYQISHRLIGFEPHIVCISADDYPDEEQRDGIFFHRIHMGRLYKRLFQKITRLDPWSYARRAAALIYQIKPDIVHVHNAPVLFGEIVQHYHGPGRLILHMHNAMPIARLPSDATLFTVSRYLKDWYATRLPSADIRIVTNGVDLNLFQPLPQLEISGLRTHLKLPTDKKIILYAGRISPEKGPLDLVHAFSELRRRRQDVFLLLVGELRTGPDRRGDYGRRLLAACKELEGDCCHAGTVNPARMHEYYQVADLAVVPSEFEEPFGMVAIEAMAAGVPVLAADKGGLREFVIHGKTGFLIKDARNTLTFAQQMHEILEQLAGLDRLRQRTRTYVEKNHGWQVVARQLESLYQNLPRPV